MAQWRFTVTDFHPETFPRKGIKVGLQITDGDKIFYRSTVVAEERTQGLSHDDIVRLAWNDLKADVGSSAVEGTTFVVDSNDTPQRVASVPQRMFEIDTTHELERLVGDIINDTLVFDTQSAHYNAKPVILRYYINLRIRQDGQPGFGEIALVGGNSISNVQLMTDLMIRDRLGAVYHRRAQEIVDIRVLTA